MRTNNKALHEIVASTIIKKLEEGTAPWQLPWNNNTPSFFLPYNAITGNRYKGINILSLLSAERNDPRWLTFKQAAAKGYSIKKGEKATPIQYVKTHDYFTPRDEHGGIMNQHGEKAIKELQKLETPIVTTAWVFNAEQVNGMEPLQTKTFIPSSWEDLQRVENLILQSKADISHTNENRAYYNSATDQIIMPYREQFDSADKYYATLLHELGHWTSHKDRLNRDIIHRFATDGYAREELRAEIASMLLGHELNIGHDPAQHIAYVESWIQLLKDKPYEIHWAAADAEKIVNFILTFDIKREQQATVAENKLAYKKESKTEVSLDMGDIINYNNASYKIHNLLKRGRFKVEKLCAENTFILSKSNALYHALLSAKKNAMLDNQHTAVLSAKEDQTKIISNKDNTNSPLNYGKLEK